MTDRPNTPPKGSPASPSCAAPLAIDRIALVVADLDRVGRFYEQIVGLTPLPSEPMRLSLGVAGRTLIELREDAGAVSRPREAGLFHVALLLPSRADLGRWIGHAARARLSLDGVADHLVSEALYLHDPEGNGVELYVDRPREVWARDGARVKMASLPLDLEALAAEGDGEWSGAPAGTCIGHVHLQVGDTARAEAFYAGELGFDVAARIPGATFFASGGYHHHLAVNVWNSRGAGPRSADSAGLAEVRLLAEPALAGRLGRSVAVDPWGTHLTITARGA